MNVYDFDKTIYNGDSTFDFYIFCLKKNPTVIFGLRKVFLPYMRYLLGFGTKTEFKEKIYEGFLPKINVDTLLTEFWSRNIGKIKKFYYDMHRDDDIIISASPYFLLKPCADVLKIKYLYASDVDKKSGKYSGVNCHGEEKVIRFEKAGFKREDIESFFSDSLSDSPLANISQKAYIVKGERLIPWEEYKRR